jgi:hypothetical protein
MIEQMEEFGFEQSVAPSAAEALAGAGGTGLCQKSLFECHVTGYLVLNQIQVLVERY